jgi:UV DNA damage endonuclease
VVIDDERGALGEDGAPAAAHVGDDEGTRLPLADPRAHGVGVDVLAPACRERVRRDAAPPQRAQHDERGGKPVHVVVRRHDDRRGAALEELPGRADDLDVCRPAGRHPTRPCKPSARSWLRVCLRRTHMLARLGFVASVLSEDISTSRTCRLKNATPARLRELIGENLEALGRVATFLERHRILLYRVSSNVVPFASHRVNELEWREEFRPQLTALGDRFREVDVRVSMHPGQFTVLNSPTAAIVKASIAELEYHARLLDALGTPPASKIVLHVGGLYGGTEHAALERFCAAAADLSDTVRRRLVIENDDRLFDAEEVLWAAERVGVPVVFDWLHHHANPCRTPLAEVLPAIFATWRRGDGRPKIHLSSQAADAPAGAHADGIDPADARACFDAMPRQPFDCMLEAKEKDRALLALRAALRRRGVAEADLQRAPAAGRAAPR